MSAHEQAALIADDIACWFHLPQSWIDRAVLRQPARVVKAVDGLSFSIPRGTTFSIVGESGCGKSTVARMVVGLQAPTRGTFNFAKGRGRARAGALSFCSARRGAPQPIFCPLFFFPGLLSRPPPRGGGGGISGGSR